MAQYGLAGWGAGSVALGVPGMGEHDTRAPESVVIFVQGTEGRCASVPCRNAALARAVMKGAFSAWQPLQYSPLMSEEISETATLLGADTANARRPLASLATRGRGAQSC